MATPTILAGGIKGKFESVTTHPIPAPVCPDKHSQILCVGALKANPPNTPTGWAFVGQSVHPVESNGLYVFIRMPVGGAAAGTVNLTFPVANAGTFTLDTIDGEYVPGSIVLNNKQAPWATGHAAPNLTTQGDEQLVYSSAATFYYARDIKAVAGETQRDFNYTEPSVSIGSAANAKATSGVFAGVQFNSFEAETTTPAESLWVAVSLAFAEVAADVDPTTTDLEEINLDYVHIKVAEVGATVFGATHATNSPIAVEIFVRGSDGQPFEFISGVGTGPTGVTVTEVDSETDITGTQRFTVTSTTSGTKNIVFVYGVDDVTLNVPISYTQNLEVPTNPAVTSLTSTSMRLTYDDVSTNEDGFQVQYREVINGVPQDWQVGPTVGPGVEQVDITNLQPNSGYDFRVRSYIGSSFSEWSTVSTTVQTGELKAVCYVDDLKAVGADNCKVQIWRYSATKHADSEIAFLEGQQFELVPDYDPLDGKQKAKMICDIPSDPINPIVAGQTLVMVIQRDVGQNEIWTRMIKNAQALEI